MKTIHHPSSPQQRSAGTCPATTAPAPENGYPENNASGNNTPGNNPSGNSTPANNASGNNSSGNSTSGSLPGNNASGSNTPEGGTVVILGDGDYPSAPQPLALLEQADTVICCDGAVLQLLAHGRQPDYIVGDMDTLDAESQRRFAALIRRDPDQEYNDQTKAFRFALTLRPRRICLLGATGRREDHTLGNISLLADYARHEYCRTTGCSVEMVTDYGIFTSYSDSVTLPGRPGEQVSVFAFDPTLNIRSEGLLYPTGQVVFDRWWKATLNEVTGDSFRLEFNHPSDILLFRNFALKR